MYLLVIRDAQFHFSVIILTQIFFCVNIMTEKWNWASRITSGSVSLSQSTSVISSDIYTYLASSYVGEINFYNGANTTPVFTLPAPSVDGNFNVFIAKCDNVTGNFVWVSSITGALTKNLFIQVSQSSVYVSGTISGTASFVNSDGFITTPSITSSGTDLYVGKLNLFGIWQSSVRATNLPYDVTLRSNFYLSDDSIYIGMTLGPNTTVSLFDSNNNFSSLTPSGSPIPSTLFVQYVVVKTDVVTWSWATRISGLTESILVNSMSLSNNYVYVNGAYASTMLFYGNNSNASAFALTNPSSNSVYVCQISKLSGITGGFVAKMSGDFSDSYGTSHTTSDDFYVSAPYTGSVGLFAKPGTGSAQLTVNTVPGGTASRRNKIVVAKISSSGSWQWFSRISSINTTNSNIAVQNLSITTGTNLFFSAYTSILSTEFVLFYNGNTSTPVSGLNLQGKLSSSVRHLFNGMLDFNTGNWLWSNIISPLTTTTGLLNQPSPVVNMDASDVSILYTQNQSINIYGVDHTTIVATPSLVSGNYFVLIKYNLLSGAYKLFKKVSVLSSSFPGSTSLITSMSTSKSDNFTYIAGVYNRDVSFYNDNIIDSALTRLPNASSPLVNRNSVFISQFGDQPPVPCFAKSSLLNIELPEDAQIVDKNISGNEWVEFNIISSPLYLTRDHLVLLDDKSITVAENTKNNVVNKTDDVVDIETTDGRFIEIKGIMVKTTKKSN